MLYLSLYFEVWKTPFQGSPSSHIYLKKKTDLEEGKPS